jgi:hypothetical protein
LANLARLYQGEGGPLLTSIDVLQMAINSGTCILSHYLR